MNTQKIKGIKIRLLNYIITAVAMILYIVLIYETVNISIRYNSLVTTTQDYIISEKDAHQLEAASDYLTEQVRLYVINMTPKYAEAFFTEINVTKRREQALQELQSSHVDNDIYELLEKALEKSNKLAETEIYAMKLISVANQYDDNILPEELKEIELNEEDAQLSFDEKIEKARTMVFDSSYLDTKEEIQDYVSQVTTPVLETTQKNQEESIQKLKSAIIKERIWLTLLFITHLIIFGAIVIFVIKPLNLYVKCIKNNQLIEVTGAYEFQYLASTYNNIYTKNEAHEALLRKKAERDALTGLLNRGSFDKLTHLLENSEAPLALLLIDVDNFKMVNDSNGHDVGDQILKKVGQVLLRSFRSSDYVFRYGGDEFAVIMSCATREQQSVIQRKVDEMNRFLTNPEDELPPVSLSIGVAFATKGYSKEVFNQADDELYEVKEHGRCGCAFSTKNG